MWTRIAIAVVLLVAFAVVAAPSRDERRPAAGPGVWVRPVSAATSPAEAKLDAVLAEVRFERTPLGDALDRLGRQAGANLLVDWQAIEGAGIRRTAPVTVSFTNVALRDALAAVFLQTAASADRLGCAARGTLIHVAPERSLPAIKSDLRVYDVADIVLAERERYLALRRPPAGGWPAPPVRPGTRPAGADSAGLLTAQGDEGDWKSTQEFVDEVIGAVQKIAVPETWRETGGTEGHIWEMTGRLIVLQTPAGHREVEAVLAAIRETAKWPVPSPAAATRPATRP